ncbi:hypothetical protein BBO99_00001478 [Phytophthora kernoviae]|uniref:Transmembrane protein 70 n=1 Tax=Phytophthora kernoviae TaxID=325452 RepID=A0A3R7G9C0_9STRA|nr:hypothetical protein JM16_002156 [Phytophthora kernoviae]RLN43839.1 hypothetical protein BBI17_001209 [Phytophthora kernoviae]RLN84260.1 hypothetical protein BBO99_00001478 [Phytophthora kernoviae]
MLLYRGPRGAVRLATAFSASCRSISSTPQIVKRSVHVSVLQQLPSTFYSRRNAASTENFIGRRWSSNVSAPQTDDDVQKKHEEETERILQQVDAVEGEPVYQGPMARAVRIMKGVSVTSCILTSIGMPVLCVVSEQDASMIGKWAMCSTVMLFGLGTTSLFHYLFKPYVIRMWIANSEAEDGAPVSAATGASVTDDSMVTVETMSLFARPQKHSFLLSEVSPPKQHPMVSFQARDRQYFIHPEEFKDIALLKKFMPGWKK